MLLLKYALVFIIFYYTTFIIQLDFSEILVIYLWFLPMITIIELLYTNISA